MRLTGIITKQSNSTVQIRPPPWLNLRRKPEIDLLPLELDFLYGLDRPTEGGKGPAGGPADVQQNSHQSFSSLRLRNAQLSCSDYRVAANSLAEEIE